MSINGVAFTASPLPTLDFGENVRLSGQVCNRFRGTGELVDGVLKVSLLTSTRMACPPGPLGELEPMLMAMLKVGVELSAEGSYLILKEGGNTLKYKVKALPAETGY